MGCPCPSYDCEATETTTATTVSTTTPSIGKIDSILVLNQYKEDNPPLLYTIGGKLKINKFKLFIARVNWPKSNNCCFYLGEVNSDINFEFGEGSGSYFSCSAVLAGKMMIFGGRYSPYNTQISQVQGCRLERVGSFPGSVYLPACNTFGASPNERVWICFNLENKSGCKRFHSQKKVIDLTRF